METCGPAIQILATGIIIGLVLIKALDLLYWLLDKLDK